MIIKPKYLEPVFGVLDEVALSSVPIPAGAVYVSPVIDRRLTPTFAELISIAVVSFDENFSGDVDVWVYYDPGPGGEDEAAAWVSGAVVYASSGSPKWVLDTSVFFHATMKKAGTFELSETLGGEGVGRFSFNAAAVFDGIVPARFAVVLHNKTPASLYGAGGSGDRPWCQIVGAQAEAT